MASNVLVVPHNKGSAIPRFATEIYAEVVFGTPSKKCLGTGICKVLPVRTIRSCECKTTRVKIFKQEEQSLVFQFRRSKICATKERHFKDGQFTLEESVEIPLFVKAQLEMEALFILSGSYPITENDLYVTVVLSVI